MSEDAVDLAVFNELRDTAGADFVAELVGTFCDEAKGILAELSEAGAAGDAVRCKRAAHSLKSNANTFGASRLAAMARDIELKGLGPDASRQVADLTAEYERAALCLREMANVRT